MNEDPVHGAFLETVAEDVAKANAESDIVHLVPSPIGGLLPDTYKGVLKDVEHLERTSEGTVCVSAAAVPFTVHFPPDYCSSTDPQLQFRVARVHVPLVHPNCRGGIICLGPYFRPGTRPRPLIEEIYSIVVGRNAATDHAFDADACKYYLTHVDQVRALRARPLWRRTAVARSRVERLGGRP